MTNGPLEAMTETMMHLRMLMAGHTSYSASPTRADRAWAEEVIARLKVYGFGLSKIDRPATSGNYLMDFRQRMEPPNIDKGE